MTEKNHIVKTGPGINDMHNKNTNLKIQTDFIGGLFLDTYYWNKTWHHALVQGRLLSSL
jgi:hypothetical protein